jgi:hypothetical protein
MKKLVGIILGIEVGIIIWFLLSLTLIIYLVVGLLNYAFPSIPQSYFSIATIILTILPFAFIFTQSIDKNYESYKTACFVLPIISGVIFFAFSKEPNKEKAVMTEIEKGERSIFPESHDRTKRQINSLLTSFTKKYSKDRNNIHLKFFKTEQQEATEITIDELYYNPTNFKEGQCIYSFFADSIYYSSILYFTIKDTNVYELSSIDKTASFGKSKKETLINLKYELLIKNKERIEVDQEDYLEQKKVIYPTLVQKGYWTKTLKEDTLNMTYSGTIKNETL